MTRRQPQSNSRRCSPQTLPTTVPPSSSRPRSTPPGAPTRRDRSGRRCSRSPRAPATNRRLRRRARSWARRPARPRRRSCAQGLDALYQRHDPTTAAAEFQQVLANNPTHYGATFQLAAALDAAGQPKEARPYWEKALAMAQRYADTETADRVRARLAAPDVPSDETLMRHGLDALYTQHDPAAAAAEFRQVLARNPTHYGATFQLAAALDAAGKRAEARLLWKKMLDMSVVVNDIQTAATVRDRLAHEP